MGGGEGGGEVDEPCLLPLITHAGIAWIYHEWIRIEEKQVHYWHIARINASLQRGSTAVQD